MKKKAVSKTRIAPSPNGHLHLGNVFNFLHTYRFSKKVKASLALRIDDHDFVRCKSEYVDEIFKALDLLEINIDEGPSSSDDFYLNYTQEKKREFYFSKLKELKSQFVCECSRKEVFKNNKEGIYSGVCHDKNLAFSSRENVIRYLCPNEVVKFRDHSVNIHKCIGDTILWRKDDIVSYQWMSLCEDLDMEITHIVRGEDLLNSSAIQVSLANALGAKFVATDNFHHHKLLQRNGEKLSKSRGDSGAMDLLKNS